MPQKIKSFSPKANKFAKALEAAGVRSPATKPRPSASAKTLTRKKGYKV